MSILVLLLEEMEKNVIAQLETDLAQEFKKEVLHRRKLLQRIPGYNTERKQYSALPLWKLLARERADYGNFDRILAIVDIDLYLYRLNYVFGIAMENIAIVSTKRLRPEFYGLKSDASLFYSRLLKESVHELGHTYGLSHCEDRFCVMYFSNNIFDTDIKGHKFCSRCRRLLI